MNVHIQERLRAKERELWAEMSRRTQEAREIGGSGARNGAESAASKETVFQETAASWELYTQVQDALRRLDDGTYGKCAACGHPIEAKRLESVPWKTYCLHHQPAFERTRRA